MEIAINFIYLNLPLTFDKKYPTGNNAENTKAPKPYLGSVIVRNQLKTNARTVK